MVVQSLSFKRNNLKKRLNHVLRPWSEFASPKRPWEGRSCLGETSLKVKSMSAIRAAMFLKAFPNMWGTPASVGMPISRPKAAILAIPARNFVIST